MSDTEAYEVSHNHGIGRTSDSVQDSDSNKTLASFTEVFCSNEKSARKCTVPAVDSDDKKCSQTDELDATGDKCVENVSVEDGFGKGLGSRVVSEHSVSSSDSGNFMNESLQAKSFSVSSSSVDILRKSICNEGSVSTEEVPCLDDSSVSSATLREQWSACTPQSLLVDLTEAGPANVKTCTASGRPEITGKNWSMGHGILTANGKQLEVCMLEKKN